MSEDVDVVLRTPEREGNRALGPEMVAERWIVIGGDSIVWLHEPSHRSVATEGPYPRKTDRCDTMGVPALHGEPLDPATNGYVVRCAVHDEHGNPTAGDAFWVESYGEAIRHARRIRQSVLDEQRARTPDFREQLTLDDALEAKPDLTAAWSETARATR